MAKCDLTIELDDPKSVHAGGGTITGAVHVNVDKTVTTKGLLVESCWATHGRGNVDSGTVKTRTLYTGEWIAGAKHEYRFELPIGNWPPSYHGSYLNVDHYVKARVLIPWGFDPKASATFLMRPVGGGESTKKPEISIVGNMIGCVLGAGILPVIGYIVITAMFGAVAAPVVLLLFSLVPIIGGLYWFIWRFLPKFALGNVEYSINPERASPGGDVAGELVIHPRKNVNINGIKMTFIAEEKVVSGSGTNRSTHSNVFFQKETTLQGEGVLQAGQTHRIPVSVTLPDDAPYTIDLSDNKLIWSTVLRIDIPRWPDWTSTKAIDVVPSDKEPSANQTNEQTIAAASAQPAASETSITFAETANHVWGMRQDHDSVNELTDAVTGLTFDIEAFVERRLLYSGEEDPHCYKDGYAIWAHFTDPPLPMVLYVPHDLADEFEQIGRDLWRGRGTIVGWDSQHRRLQIKLESQTG